MHEFFAPIHSQETLSSVDGHGLRSVVFLSGCSLRCVFCHNPDMFEAGQNLCSASSLARSIIGYKPFYARGGGLTFSGGEPLLHAQFCKAVALLVQAEGISVAVQTSGSVFNEHTQSLLRTCDHIYLDVKHTHAQGYKDICGGDFEVLLRTLDFLHTQGIAYHARYVAVPHLTDSVQHAQEFKRLTFKAQSHDVLGYHTMGQKKYEALKMQCPLSQPALSTDTLQSLKQALKFVDIDT